MSPLSLSALSTRTYGYAPPTGRFGALLDEEGGEAGGGGAGGADKGGDKSGAKGGEERGSKGQEGGQGGGADTVQLSRKEYDALMAAQGENKTLKGTNTKLQKTWDNVQKIMRGDTDPAAKEQATRETLADAGYTQEQVDEYVARQFPKKGAKRGTQQNDGDGEGEDPQATELRSLREGMESMRLENLNNRMAGHISTGLTSHKDVTKLFEDVKTLNGEDGVKNLTTILRGEVDAATREALRDRRRREGRFDPSWIDEEVPKAFSTVVKKYRSVMPDVSKIGRAGETDSGEEEFLATKPVEPPKYKPGMSMGDAHEQLSAFLGDALRRTAIEAERGGKSVV